MARASAGEAAVAPAASAVTRTASGTAGVGTAGAVGMFTVASDRSGATVAVGTAVDDASACQVWHTVAGNLMEAGSCCQWLPVNTSPRLHEVRCVACGALWHLVDRNCRWGATVREWPSAEEHWCILGIVAGSSFPPLGHPYMGCSTGA
jgi:hypothetical protein